MCSQTGEGEGGISVGFSPSTMVTFTTDWFRVWKNRVTQRCTDVTKLHLHCPIENSVQSLPTNKMKFQKYMLMKTR
jgi:hypothetical protein